MKTTATNLFKFGLGTFLGLSPLLMSTASASAVKCSAIFSSPTGEITREQINQAILELSTLRLNIDKSQALGANSMTRAALEKDFHKKLQLVTQYVETSHVMTRIELAESIKTNIAKLQNRDTSKEKEEEQQSSTLRAQQERNMFDKINSSTLHRVGPGSYHYFHDRTSGIGLKVDVTKPYDLMATPTTQYLWRKVVELSQQHFPGKYNLNADPSHFKGDRRPVESVSNNTVEIWFNALNELSSMGEPTLKTLIAGHEKGSVYRLPSDLEWQQVAQERGEIDMFRMNHRDYGWFENDKRDGETQEVGLKKPMVLDGKEFYDMIGNVSEYTAGRVSEWGQQPRYNDLQKLDTTSKFVLALGGNYDGSWRNLRNLYSPGRGNSTTGFRIARSVEDPNPPVQQPIQQPVVAKATAQPRKTIWQKLSEIVRYVCTYKESNCSSMD